MAAADDANDLTNDEYGHNADTCSDDNDDDFF